MLDYDHLSALSAILRTGSFEKAARQLGLTPSAISQRIKALEERVGAVLVVRGQPCRPTLAGQRLFRHAEEVALLEAGLGRDLGEFAGMAKTPSLRLAVNADSLATWFVPAMAAVDAFLYDLVLDDQDHSAEWLRRGEVRAAVTGSSQAVQGCDCLYLGRLRYFATASPDFMARWFPDGVTAERLAVAPTMTFNTKDTLQSRWLALAFAMDISPPTHWLPSSHGFVDATLAGVGWGMNPEILVSNEITGSRLLMLLPDRPLDIPLYWHWSRSAGPALKVLTEAVLATARRLLVQDHP
ncbi:LysR family transcriptional regulator ArgP [Rhizobium daejeonense]|uniref:LysR family transcriptional regulator ArgP n=1 Tax=Rhizobium daejeonense TaxID=240521 RepID=UPI00197CB868|nr:LysR family transcriptional regulator ArgP [Rhizobium daejeonense]